MEDDQTFVSSMRISFPIDLLTQCLQSHQMTWDVESPETETTFKLTSVIKQAGTGSVLEFNLSELNVLCVRQSIELKIDKAQKRHIEEFSKGDIFESLNMMPAPVPGDDTSMILMQNDEEKEEFSVKHVSPIDLKDNIAGSNVNSEFQVSNQLDLPLIEKPKPKKRGRKPKSKAVPKDPIIPIQSDEQSGRKRYGLRGVKLSSAVMEAVKGKGYSGDLDDLDLTVDDFDMSEDFVADNIKDTGEIDTEGEQDQTDAMAQTDYDNDVKTDVAVVNGSSADITPKKKLSFKRSLKMYKKFKESNRGLEKKKILAAIGNLYSKERRRKNIDKKASCKYCGKSFCDFTGVDSHVKKFHMKEADVNSYIEELVPLKQVICSICNATLPSRLQLQVHEDREHSKTISPCMVCGKVFKNLQFLRNHMKITHLNSEEHMCHLCSSKFKQAISLRQHIEEIHERKRNVTCKVCGKMFYRQAQLNRHSRIHDVNGKKIICPRCGRGFNFECNLQRHLQVVHAPKTERFHCSYCGKGFNTKSTMNAHVQKLHFNLCPFVCEVCRSPFMRSKQLEDHMAHAHNVTGFKVANPREKLFKYNRSNEDMFSCSYCQENFFYKAQLVDHVQCAHYDVFPHRCEHCNHGFLEKEFLLRHEHKAHGAAPEPLLHDNQQIIHVASSTTPNTVQVVPLSMDVSSQQEDNNSEFQDVILSVDEAEADLQSEEVVNQEDVSTAASVLVEISNDDNTIQYVIQGGDNSSNVVVHDIASLLLAAEQSLHDNSGAVTLATVDGESIAMETTENSDLITPNVITISNSEVDDSEVKAQILENPEMEEITVIMKEET